MLYDLEVLTKELDNLSKMFSEATLTKGTAKVNLLKAKMALADEEVKVILAPEKLDGKNQQTRDAQLAEYTRVDRLAVDMAELTYQEASAKADALEILLKNQRDKLRIIELLQFALDEDEEEER